MKETILQAENLRFRYDPDAAGYALDGVTAGVKRGEFVAVLGANGCGKSTLAKHFNAILLPESGTVTVEGMDTADDSKLYEIRQKVGMVFQNPDNQIVATVVEEDVAFGLENLGVPSGEMRQRIDDAMKNGGGQSEDVVEHCGDIYYMTGDVAKALEYWQKAIKMDDNESKTLERKIKLKKYIAE